MPRRPWLVAAATTLLLAACSSPHAAAPTPGQSPRSTATTPTAAPGLVPTPLFFIPVAGQPPVAGRPWYLAIGDSVTFGFTVDPARFGTNSSWALQLQPLLAATGRTWTLYDTACSGERTDTYFTRCPGRRQVPFLHDQSQHDAALAAIAAHRADLRAIFVELGSNDLLADQRDNLSVDQSTARLRTQLTTIVQQLQAAAPGVPVVVCNYYDPLANALPATLAEIQVVNAMVAQVATARHARLADFFSAINSVATGHDATLCTYVDCAHGDVHPTVGGQARLAHAALAALDGS